MTVNEVIEELLQCEGDEEVRYLYGSFFVEVSMITYDEETGNILIM